MKNLKELAEKSGIYNLKLDNETDYWIIENFGKLIISECARIARATPCPYTEQEMIKQLGHTWDMACAESGSEIVKHFGVKDE